MNEDIYILDNNTANQIAAGEVIEAPLNVVKELVENSLDSLCTQIIVKIKDGAMEEIFVSDNGKGIKSVDLKNALMRHGTSKLNTIDDLYTLETMGFRGEALASIQSVSKILIKSKHRDDTLAYEISGAGGKISEPKLTSLSAGTTISVKDLFFNTPPRKKFLDSKFKETKKIANLMERFALSRPDISFDFYIDDKRVFKTFGTGNLLDCINIILNPYIGNNVLPFKFKDDVYDIHGYLSNRTLTRGLRDHIFLYINGRIVRSKELTKYILDGYKNIIPQKRFPVIVLNINVPTYEVEVNIHPRKEEVKIDKIGELGSLIEKIVRDTLYNEQNLKKEQDLQEGLILEKKEDSLLKDNKSPGGQTLDPNSQKENLAPTNKQQYTNNPDDFSYLEFVEDGNSNFQDSEFLEKKDNGIKTHINEVSLEQLFPINNQGEQVKLKKDSAENINLKKKEIQEKKEVKEVEISDDPQESYTFKFQESKLDALRKKLDKNTDLEHQDNEIISKVLDHGDKTDPVLLREAGETIPNPTLFTEEAGNVFSNLRIIGVYKNTYILGEMDEELYVFDQHAVHERINFEKNEGDFAFSDFKTQMLLEPSILELSTSRYLDVLSIINDLGKYGIILELFSNSSFLVRGLPFNGTINDPNSFVEDVIDLVLNDENHKTIEDKIIEKASCVESVKGNDVLNNEEIKDLILGLGRCEYMLTCPHGRPTYLKYTLKDVMKMFLRV